MRTRTISGLPFMNVGCEKSLSAATLSFLSSHGWPCRPLPQFLDFEEVPHFSSSPGSGAGVELTQNHQFG